MMQPFILFEPAYIERLILLNKCYLVAQSYPRGFEQLAAEHPVDLLLTDYDDPGLAKTHLNALKNDPHGCILELAKEKHVLKLRELLAGKQYRIFWSVVLDPKDIKKRLDKKYVDRIRRYVASTTNWRIGADERIQPSMQVIFGEIYLILKRGTQSIRVKFEEIEKL